MKSYDVTIGMPVYESEPYLRKALESALAQTYPSIEFLLVDDGSRDGSHRMMEAFRDSHPRGGDIRILCHEVNWGVAASRNQIIDEARGAYLYFMDSDDVIRADTIDLLLQNSRRCDAEIVFGSYEKIELSGERRVYKYSSVPFIGEDLLACFAYRKYGGIQASACNFLVSTSFLRGSGVRFLDTPFWEDYAFVFELVTHVSRAVMLSDITYTYLCRENSLSAYQQRTSITKEEVMRNVATIDHLKATSAPLYNKVYFPNRCRNIMLGDFFMACYILRRRKDIRPQVTAAEIKAMMSHPATWRQIWSFREVRLENMLLCVLGKLPAWLCVVCIWMIGKMKKLI